MFKCRKYQIQYLILPLIHEVSSISWNQIFSMWIRYFLRTPLILRGSIGRYYRSPVRSSGPESIDRIAPHCPSSIDLCVSRNRECQYHQKVSMILYMDIWILYMVVAIHHVSIICIDTTMYSIRAWCIVSGRNRESITSTYQKHMWKYIRSTLCISHH